MPARRPRKLEHTQLNADTIRHLIEQGLPGARADVRGDDGVHFEATVVSEAFRGKLPLARHRMRPVRAATAGSLIKRIYPAQTMRSG